MADREVGPRARVPAGAAVPYLHFIRREYGAILDLAATDATFASYPSKVMIAANAARAVYRDCGDGRFADEALHHFENASATGSVPGLVIGIADVLCDLGRSGEAELRLRAAIEERRAAVEGVLRAGDASEIGLLRVALARLVRDAGRGDEAEAEVLRALESTRVVGPKNWFVHQEKLVGDCIAFWRDDGVSDAAIWEFVAEAATKAGVTEGALARELPRLLPDYDPGAGPEPE